MAWDFQTDPDLQRKLDWVETFVAEELIPLEPIVQDFTPEQWRAVQEPLKQQVR